MATWTHLPHDMGGKNARRVEGGRRGKRKGIQFEKTLSDFHEILSATGQAAIHKTGPLVEWKPGPGGRAVPTVVAEGPCDYIGVMNAQAVFFEAKTVPNKEQWSIPMNALHQLVWLQSAAACGALAFYLVRWDAHDEVRVHPLDTIDDRTLLRVEGTVVEGGVDWRATVLGMVEYAV